MRTMDRIKELWENNRRRAVFVCKFGNGEEIRMTRYVQDVVITFDEHEAGIRQALEAYRCRQFNRRNWPPDCLDLPDCFTISAAYYELEL